MVSRIKFEASSVNSKMFDMFLLLINFYWNIVALQYYFSFHCTAELIGCTYTYMCMLSCVWFFVTPWTIAHQAPLSMGFSRQEYSSGWVVISCSRGSSQPRDQTQVSCTSCIGRWTLYYCATWGAHVYIYPLRFEFPSHLGYRECSRSEKETLASYINEYI